MEAGEHQVGGEGLRKIIIDRGRPGGPIEPVTGSHLNSSAYDSWSKPGAHGGGEHKTDSHRVGGEGLRQAASSRHCQQHNRADK